MNLIVSLKNKIFELWKSILYFSYAFIFVKSNQPRRAPSILESSALASASFSYISGYYPYDGSDAEINGFYNKLLDVEKYIFNNLY